MESRHLPQRVPSVFFFFDAAPRQPRLVSRPCRLQTLSMRVAPRLSWLVSAAVAISPPPGGRALPERGVVLLPTVGLTAMGG